MSVLKWIWGLLKKVWSLLDYVVRFLVEIFSSVLGWAIAGLSYVIHLVFQYVGEFFLNLFSAAQSTVLPSLPSNGLANFLARDLLALNVAWECLVIFVSVWIASRIARASFGAVRAVLDII